MKGIVRCAILHNRQIEVKTTQPRSQALNAISNDSDVLPPHQTIVSTSRGRECCTDGSCMRLMFMNNAGAGDMSMMYQHKMSGMGTTPYCAMMGSGMGMMDGSDPMMGMGDPASVNEVMIREHFMNRKAVCVLLLESFENPAEFSDLPAVRTLRGPSVSSKAEG
ncbi:hypothetical protein BJY52DRAFT_361863 [Lactarius psammicola]|nr:hypothetical protein BJY52DRAFT_361863 [Lactarius psammicola]